MIQTLWPRTPANTWLVKVSAVDGFSAGAGREAVIRAPHGQLGHHIQEGSSLAYSFSRQQGHCPSWEPTRGQSGLAAVTGALLSSRGNPSFTHSFIHFQRIPNMVQLPPTWTTWKQAEWRQLILSVPKQLQAWPTMELVHVLHFHTGR